MKPERMCPTLKPSRPRASTGVEASKQPHLLIRKMRSTTVDGCRQADAAGLEQGGSISLRAIVGVKPGKTPHLAALLKVMLLDMGWLHGEVETGSE